MANCPATNSTEESKSNSMAEINSETHLPSLLDHFEDNSNIRKSEFRGFANLFIIGSVFYAFYDPIIHWYEGHDLIDPELANAMFKDFFFLVFIWLKLHIWSFTAFGLHLLYMKKRISSSILFLLQHLSQAACIFYAISQCLYNDWPIIPAAFVQVMAVIYFMKMHSFTEINREYCDKVGTSEANEVYPRNINLWNFFYYLCCPVLVYEPAYTRGPGFRLNYFLSKFFTMIGSMGLMYLACTSYIVPTIISSPKMSFVEAFIRLIFPLLSVNLLMFYIVFECVCNLFAEVTNFGDREFYQDWWNSSSWDEFSRKWNRPVHAFLQRHIYLEPQRKYHWSQRDATFATFIFSACLHEMIMAVCFRLVRMYLFLMMLLQLPLIALGRFYKKTTAGNCIFWIGIMLGAPILAVAYGREWAQLALTQGIEQTLEVI